MSDSESTEPVGSSSNTRDKKSRRKWLLVLGLVLGVVALIVALRPTIASSTAESRFQDGLVTTHFNSDDAKGIASLGVLERVCKFE